MSDKTTSLHLQLNKKGYICDKSFGVNLNHAIKTKPVGGAFLFGPAGTGKSYLPMVLSKLLKRKLYMYQCSTGTREDDLLLKMLPSEKTVSGIKIEESVVYKAAIKSKDEKIVLVFDEWDKTRPTADGFFLDFLQYGRLSIPGRDVSANLNNMLIFFTSNNERDISEALLRRFPKIDVEPLGTDVVFKALCLTHKGHAHMGNVLSLYEKTLQSEMTKPATIQELRQLLDAITLLNDSSEDCDWDTLVYMYVTKTPENHELLRKAVTDGGSQNATRRKRISSVYFDEVSSPNSNDSSSHSDMPTLIDLNGYDATVGSIEVEADDAKITCLLEKDDDNYSNSVKTQLVAFEGELTSDPADIDWIRSVKGSLISTKPIMLCNLKLHDRLFADKRGQNARTTGEVMVFEPNVCWDDMVDLLSCNNSNIIIRKAEKDEVIGRYSFNTSTVDFRWTPETGIELIAKTSRDGLGALHHFVGEEVACWYDVNMTVKVRERDVYTALSYNPFVRPGEMVLKNCIGYSSYAHYALHSSPSGNRECDDRDVPSLNILENISKVKYGTRFTRYTGKGIVINTYHSKQYGRNYKWDVIVTGPFDSRFLTVLYSWYIDHFHLYYATRLPGFKVAEQLVEKFNWKRCITDTNGNRLVKSKAYKCFIYPDALMFSVDITSHKVKHSTIDKLDEYIVNVIKWLDGWKDARNDG